MVALVIVVFDKSLNLGLKIVGQEVAGHFEELWHLLSKFFHFLLATAEAVMAEQPGFMIFLTVTRR